MPPQQLHNRFAMLIQELPPQTDELARQHQAFTRARQIKSVAELFYLVCLYSFADLSTREIAGVCIGCGISLTDEAVRLRLAACRPWLMALLAKLLPATRLPLRQRPWRLLICDGSQISCPSATGTDYRWHLSYDPLAQEIDQLQLRDCHTSESLTLFNFTDGDLVLADRHYAKATALVATRKQGAHLLVRCTPSYLPLWTRQLQPFDLLAALRGIGHRQQVSFALAIYDRQSGDGVPVWVHAHHLNAEQINRARRRIKRRASRNGQTPRAQTLLLSEWVLVLTTVPPEELSGAVMLQLYRVRWQIELLIKRYKSLLSAAKVRSRAGSPLTEVYLLGKLLFAVLLEGRAVRRLGQEWTQMSQERPATWWRVWKLMAKEMIAEVLETAVWGAWDWQSVLRGLAERKRQRKLQVIAAEVIEWLNTTPLVAWREAA